MTQQQLMSITIPKTICELDFSQNEMSFALIKKLQGLEHLSTLSLTGCFSLKMTKTLDTEMRSLRRLELKQTGLHDEDLKLIAESKAFKFLEWLDISDNEVTDLKPIFESTQFQELEYLIATGNKIHILPNDVKSEYVCK